MAALIQPYPTAREPAALFDQSTGRIIVTVDATVSETHGFKNTITDHPVEEGAPISDHSRPEPDEITVECVVSDTPINQVQYDRAVAAGAVAAGPTSTGFGALDGYADSVFKIFRDLHLNPRIVKVVTLRQTRENMTIVSSTFPVDSKSVSAVRWTMTLREFKTVSNKTTRTTVAKTPNAQGKKSTGTVTPEETDLTQDEDALQVVKGGIKLFTGK